MKIKFDIKIKKIKYQGLKKTFKKKIQTKQITKK